MPLWLAFRFNDRHRFRSFEPRSVNAFPQQRNRRDAEPTVVARSVLATAAKAAQSGGVAEGPRHVKWSACGGCMGTVLESMWRNVLHIVGNNYDRAKGIFLSTLENQQQLVALCKVSIVTFEDGLLAALSHEERFMSEFHNQLPCGYLMFAVCKT